MLVKGKQAYQFWHKHLNDINRVDRQTIGVKIDEQFMAMLEFIFRACFANDKFEKLSMISQAIGKADLLKFFLQMAWEQKIIANAHYSPLLLSLDEIGRMLGGWKKTIQEKTPTK